MICVFQIKIIYVLKNNYSNISISFVKHSNSTRARSNEIIVRIFKAEMPFDKRMKVNVVQMHERNQSKDKDFPP